MIAWHHSILLSLSTLLISCGEVSKNHEPEGLNNVKAVRPNIVWLMAEDISTDLACYGMAGVETPHLDQMAAEGIRYNNCFATSPICSPNRSAMMTGVHQVKINAHHHRSNREVPLATPYRPFTDWLRKEGYTTILGHHGVRGKGRKTDVNFKHEKVGPWDGKDHFGLFDKTDHFEADDAPFFVQIQLNVTHRGDWWDDIRRKSPEPVDPDEVSLPPYFADNPIIKMDWAKYLDQIEYMDQEVGMILEELENKGLADNTVVIFIGDNGRCNIKGKGYLHDPGLRVPLLVRWPKGIEQGQVRDDIVSTTDITATILDLAGIDIPSYMTGQSIFSENFDRHEVYAARDLWDEVVESSRAIITERWKYIRNDMPDVPWDAHQAYLDFYRPAVHVMRALKSESRLTGHQRQFFREKKPREELYDLKADPFELNNLANQSEHESVLQELRQKAISYDTLMRPVSNEYLPVHPVAVDIREWVKKEEPDLYKEMLSGVEIGFQRLAKEFRQRQGSN